MSTQSSMSPSHPYIIRAIHQWIEDNECTPHLLVDASAKHVAVPVDFVQDGHIVLNLSSIATHDLFISNEYISFKARFNGVSEDIFVPMYAVRGLFTRETGEGMPFDGSDYTDAEIARIEASITGTDTVEPQKARKSNKNQQQKLDRAKKLGISLAD